MVELLTSAQMRAIEVAEIESGAVTGLELMERAGRGVVEAMEAEWPELRHAGGRAVVLCGPGNNGGDGFVVARLLKERGWTVLVGLWGDAERLPPDARANHDMWLAVGEVLSLLDYDSSGALDRMVELAGGKDDPPLYVIDALFGTGLKRALPAEEFSGLAMLGVHLDDLWIENGPTTYFVSVDIPSGLCADSGRILLSLDGENPLPPEEIDQDPRFAAIMASLTVTFHAPKLGHVLGDGPRMCGKLRVVDIGLPHSFPQLRDVTDASHGWYTRCLEKYRSNKYGNGSALVLAGGAGRGGAARLAARGALRVGAGLVTVGCPRDALTENAARLDAVMLREIGDASALRRVLQDRRIGAVCLGPGLGTGERQAGLVAAALGMPVPGLTRDLSGGVGEGSGGGPGASPGRGLVLDADALTILSRDAALFGALHERCVLTPHGGEFARLFPDIAEKLAAPAVKGPAYSKVDATREAAVRAGCVVLFKGADTVIAAPDGQCAVNSAHYERAAPWLATAGSGDVLAGFIAGLMARRFAPFEAACAGAWLHVECAREFGPGLIAEDLPEMLPAVFRRLGV